MLTGRRLVVDSSRALRSLRFSSTSTTSDKYKIVVVGAGNGGLSVANQIYDRFAAAGKSLNPGDIAIIDSAEYHYYQVCVTLVGSGLRSKSTTRQPLESLIPKHLTHISENVKTFLPESSSITTTSGRSVSYDALVVATGLQTNWSGIQGLPQALVDSSSGVSSIYSYDTCDKVWNDIESLRNGNAIFTQPAGVVKCAGAPQKIMWMALDRFKRTSRADKIKVNFYTGMPTMFSVKKYSDVLDRLRQDRGVGGYFQHNLISIDSPNHKATFKKADGTTVDVDYTTLHVTPPMGPLDFLKGSPIVDSAGWVSVDPATLQHTKPEYNNIFALGDCSSAPTSKTATAVIAQAPVLTENLFSVMDTGKVSTAKYDGYTSCPLLTGYGELLLAEFKYGLEPKETFPWMDQSKPNRFFYHLKKDLFPAAYWNLMVKGKWYGNKTIFRPSFSS
ncbi:FAD/NAD-P-binding domain-containing protein [Lentinula edodes]|uniref:FAD/NAD-P-binding domain-containing protein n=1 Tax=Lentinula edodes TaxID=5353 RepID=UPI001E8E0A41|nr:FAD/NAD-P-binding domain-containing protein [Lentinula edodes]KAH7871893.1 FAD/NAD-P-binding domain-containing protein [Lentinula edodes]